MKLILNLTKSKKDSMLCLAHQNYKKEQVGFKKILICFSWLGNSHFTIRWNGHIYDLSPPLRAKQEYMIGFHKNKGAYFIFMIYFEGRFWKNRLTTLHLSLYVHHNFKNRAKQWEGKMCVIFWFSSWDIYNKKYNKKNVIQLNILWVHLFSEIFLYERRINTYCMSSII